MHIEDFLRRAMELSASDIHLSGGHPPTYRVNGGLVMEGLAPSETDIETWVNHMLTSSQKSVLESEGQVDFAYTLSGMGRFRFNTFRTQGQTVFAIRIIPSTIPSFESLRLPSLMKKLAQLPQGLVLVTGPTGSGKSTTLATLVNDINMTQEKHVITLEDPIEYVHQHRQSIIHQREIGTDAISFASALRAALRQDPDVILVGELRDLETVRTAVTASETGHLVLSTLHTGDAVQTIDRLVDMFPGDQQGQIRSQLAGVLQSVVSQRLLPSVDERSRVALTEVLVNTPAVANLIRTQKTHQLKSVMQTSRQVGMQTFAMAARDRLQNSEISQTVAQFWLETTS